MSNCYRATKLWSIFFTKSICPTIHKDAIPSLQLSNAIYEYMCRCNCQHIGHTFQRLQDRINQHAPKLIRLGMKKEKQISLVKMQVASPLNVTEQLDNLYLKIRTVPSLTIQKSIHSVGCCWIFLPSSYPQSYFHQKQKAGLCHQKEFMQCNWSTRQKTTFQ